MNNMASDPAVLMQFSEIPLDVFLCAFSVCHGAMFVFVFTGVFLLRLYQLVAVLSLLE